MNSYARLQIKAKNLDVTIIEIRPFRNGWQVYETPGVEPVFLDQEQAIDYAKEPRLLVSDRGELIAETPRHHYPPISSE